MKKKIFILTLCFTIFISCFNFKKVDAIDFVISPAIASVVVTLGVGAGIILRDNEDIKNLANDFYNYHKNNWDSVTTAFSAAVAFESNRITSLSDGDFLNYCKDFFTSKYSVADSNSSFSSSGYLPVYPDEFYRVLPSVEGSTYIDFANIKCTIIRVNHSSTYDLLKLSISYLTPSGFIDLETSIPFYLKNEFDLMSFYINPSSSKFTMKLSSTLNTKTSIDSFILSNFISIGDSISLPGSSGFDWNKNIESKKENDKIGLYVPGNLGNLVGQVGGTIVGSDSAVPPYDLPIDGSVSVPGIGDGVIDTPTDIPGSTTPSFPSFGEDIDFSPIYATGITEKFPFSLPWDIQRILGIFNVTPKAPVFEVPLVSQKIKLDLSQFDDWASIVRFFVLIGFIIFLIMISTKLKG